MLQGTSSSKGRPWFGCSSCAFSTCERVTISPRTAYSVSRSFFGSVA